MASRKIIPPYINPGDTVGIVSPSFCVDEEKLSSAIKFLESWGLHVRPGKNVLKRHGPFAGTDHERLEDIQGVISDPTIKAVFCSRGGYGISRIIDSIDFSPLQKKPKWFAGFSDITVLHMWLSEVCGIASIHGDMPLNFNNPEKTPGTFSTLKDALFGNSFEIRWKGTTLREADVKGELTGGNLSLLYALTGTNAEPGTRGRILFIEDTGEYYYHIDRMLTSYRLAGKLEDVSAILAGGFNDMKDTRIPMNRSVEDIISEIVSIYDFPVFFGFPAGHVPDNRAFYIGREADIRRSGEELVLTFR